MSQTLDMQQTVLGAPLAFAKGSLGANTKAVAEKDRKVGSKEKWKISSPKRKTIVEHCRPTTAISSPGINHQQKQG